MTAAQDPFYLVKEEIQDSVNKVQASAKKLEQLLFGSDEYDQLRKELITACESIDWQVDELDRAISVAERDPARFGLDATELGHRRKWTSTTRNQISMIRKITQDASGKLPIKDQVELVKMPMPNDRSLPKMNRAILQENESFLASESDRQALILKEQDEDLDELSASVERLGGVGLTIHDELMGQERIIGELGQEMDNTANRLDFVQKRMAHIIKKAGAKGQLMMIVFLVFLLLILIVLVFT